jgi:hypothetical protein
VTELHDELAIVLMNASPTFRQNGIRSSRSMVA